MLIENEKRLSVHAYKNMMRCLNEVIGKEKVLLAKF
jgi:hypothetical protein